MVIGGFMNKIDIFDLLNKIYEDKIDLQKKDNISNKIILYDKYISLSSITLLDVIEKYVLLDKIGVINKIDENLFILIKRILGFKNNDKLDDYEGLYFLDYLKYMIIPYNMLSCDKEYELPKFLGEFEIFMSLIMDHASLLDLEMIKFYNMDLFKLIIFRKEKENEIIKCFNYERNFQSEVILETTLSHMLTIFYLKMDLYHKEFNIISKGYDIICNNLDKLIDYCKEKNLYNDILLSNLSVNKNILQEYEFCRDILDELNERNKKKVK